MLRSFLTNDANLARLPVALLSGSLGSGKTTLVNALLRDPAMANTAVAINEFGEIPIDQALIDHGADKTVVLANGCLCCNLAGDMEQAVMRLFSRRADGEVPRFARLIIEPSGLADPAPILQAILRNPVLSRAFRLESVVTCVDAMFATEQLARHAETRKQVALADHLVITKTDLAKSQRADLQPTLRAHNPLAPISIVTQGAIAAEALFPAGFFDPSAAAAPRTALQADAPLHPGSLQDVHAISLRCEAPIAWPEFEAWLRPIRLTYGERLLRVKGILNISGLAGPVVIQGVHHVLHAPVALPAWPDADCTSRLVLIMTGAPPPDITHSWAQRSTRLARH